MSDLWTERLSEYLDGDLGPAERLECGRHLETCAECAHTLEELRAVVARARAPEERPLAEDLWPGIESRIGSGAPERARVVRLPLGHVRFSLTLPQAAAAALLLVALSGGAMWWALSGGARAPERGTLATRTAPRGAPAEATPGVPRGTIAAAPAGFDEARYDAAVADLEGVLRQHRAELDASTVRVLEQNLALIDRAIAQARAALAADPASSYLHGHLAAQMMFKIDLLRRATAFQGARG